MKSQIRQRALDLGFDACGFTTAEPPPNIAQFQKWLANEHNGTMEYLQRNAHKRVEPRLVLKEAKTIIALAVSYGTSSDSVKLERQDSERGTSHGVIARYARFTDYHDVMGERLEELTDYVTTLGGQETCSLWYVDTGPLLERDLAERAGLGFAGKHTNLISRDLGNWIFLAEIITTLEIEPDAAEKNRCGSCTRCITACPTDAIIAPFQLDARRCISYLTIELKGPIPLELRHAMGNRIYGCDDCLAACPWNRFAQEGRMMKAHRKPGLTAMELVELLGLDEAAFKRRFAGTPILRAKRRGLLRNVSVALGNVGDASALPALEAAAQGSDTLVAEHARWAIEQIIARCAVTEPTSAVPR